MSEVDLEEFRSAYLAEVDEQLVLANARIMTIDAAAKKAEASPRAVRELYRAVHTVKGLSAMVGIEPIVAITHRMEAILRAADRGAGRLPTPAVDTLVEGLRAVENRLRALAEKKAVPPAPKALLDALETLEPGPANVPHAKARGIELDPALVEKLAPFELQALVDAAPPQRALRVDFAPSPARAAAGFTINSVRERLGVIAEIVKVLPLSMPVSAEAPGGLAFALLFVTSAQDDELAAAVGVPASAIASLQSAPAPAEVALPELPELMEQDAEPRDGKRVNMLRVDVMRLDEAMDRLAMLIVTRSRLARAMTALAASGADTRELGLILKDHGRQLRDLRGAILRVRMVPISEVLDRVPLILRGLRRDTGKAVRLVVEGANAELDKAVAERIFPAIVHIVRNAVDHAIEPPHDRIRAGKPEEAVLRITCSAASNTRFELSVADDGRGIDRAAVAATSKREVPTSDAALLDLLCTPGLSTRSEATTTSGRGMGMDIVRQIVVDQLGGELLLDTTPGRGTVFTLRVPLTIAIVDTLTLQCAGHRFVVPVGMVEEIVELDRARVRHAPAVDSTALTTHVGLIERRGETLPVVPLASAFRLNDANDGVQAVVVRCAGAPIAFALDRVLGQQEAVVRPLVDPLVQVTGVTGATDLGDGKPTLVLDLVALGASFWRKRQGGRAA